MPFYVFIFIQIKIPRVRLNPPYWIRQFKFIDFMFRFLISDLINPQIPVFIQNKQFFGFWSTILDPPIWILEFWHKFGFSGPKNSSLKIFDKKFKKRKKIVFGLGTFSQIVRDNERVNNLIMRGMQFDGIDLFHRCNLKNTIAFKVSRKDASIHLHCSKKIW